MARTPRNVVAVTPGGQITMDMILGFVALSQVPNTPQSAAKLRRLWLAEGLDESLVPKQRKPVNSFQAACRSVETRRTESLKVHEVKVDEVLENEAECVYQVTRMVRDKDHKLIDHPKGMRLTFNKRTGTIETDPLDKATFKELEGLDAAIREEFERNSSKVPGSKLRRAIRATLRDHHATLIQNKGVFFVPKAGKPALDSIQNVLRGLYGDDGPAELYVIPCANDEGEKEMVAKHFTANVADQIDKLLAEITMRLRSDDSVLRKDRRESMVGERRRIKEGTERYRNMLDDKLLVLAEKERLLDNGLEKLLGL
jgi:uncharacterized protein DUF6744